jgi:hypothetical protein
LLGAWEICESPRAAATSAYGSFDVHSIEINVVRLAPACQGASTIKKKNFFFDR